MIPQQVRFLITGHPRCGTGYMAALFRSLGVRIGHETMLDDGICSWTLAVPFLEQPWCKIQRQDLQPFWLVHAVRHPFDAIPSIAHADATSLPQRRKWVYLPAGHHEYDQAALSWIGWNHLIEVQMPDLTVQVEHAIFPVQDWLGNTVGLDLPDEPDLPARDFNSRPHPRPTPREICEEMRPEVLRQLERAAARYGYQL